MAMRLALFAVTALAFPALIGCRGTAGKGENQAREQAGTISAVYRPGGRPASLPTLDTNSTLGDFVLHAMLLQPQVEAAYFTWIGSVERITVERSLPDPRLSFETDIADIVETAMPGLMMDFPGPGKLKARAAIASAESRARYFAFERSVLEAALELKRAYYQLQLLTDQIRINRETLVLLADLEQMARTRNEAGLVTLADVLRAQIEQDRMRTETVNLVDSQVAVRARFKKALGLRPSDPEPPLPLRFEVGQVEVAPEELLAAAFERNPRLKAMAAEVQQAEAAIGLAVRTRIPDFNAGLEMDALASPIMVRPSVGVTLPIWKDKIAAEIAGAQAGKQAAEARLTAEQINLALEVAERSFVVREASRNLELFERALVPKARLALEATRAGYLSGKVDFLNLISTWQTLLGFELSGLQARTQRELALAELSLVVAASPPAGAPILSEQRPHSAGWQDRRTSP